MVTRRQAVDRLRRAVRELRTDRPPAKSGGTGGAKKAAAAKAAPAKTAPKKPAVAPVDPVVASVRAAKLTYLPVGALNDLYDEAARADSEGRVGCFLEAGCALGGSAVVITTAKDPGRPFFVHDVFGMIPPPTDEDGADIHQRYEKISSGQAKGIGGGTYYGYEEDLMGKVERTFAEFDVPVGENAVELVEGLFQDTIVGDEPVALAHIDGDWYQSVRTCLDRIGPRLPSGGVMVIDDYFHWSGCRRAVDEFVAEHPDEYHTVRRTRLHVVKN